MTNDMIAVLGESESVRAMGADTGRRLIQCFGIPCRIAGEAFVLRPGAILVPTADVPGIIYIGHHLCYFARRIISRRVLLSIDAVMHARRCRGPLKITDGGGVIAFHVVNDVELVAETGRIPVAGVSRPPDRRTVV